MTRHGREVGLRGRLVPDRFRAGAAGSSTPVSTSPRGARLAAGLARFDGGDRWRVYDIVSVPAGGVHTRVAVKRTVTTWAIRPNGGRRRTAQQPRDPEPFGTVERRSYVSALTFAWPERNDSWSPGIDGQRDSLRSRNRRRWDRSRGHSNCVAITPPVGSMIARKSRRTRREATAGCPARPCMIVLERRPATGHGQGRRCHSHRDSARWLHGEEPTAGRRRLLPGSGRRRAKWST